MTINCQGTLIDLARPKVMGIINATPDSFYGESRATELSATLRKVDQMIADGATFIDIGGMSSRPGAELITSSDERERVLPVLEAIRKEFASVMISIDTIYADTARASIEHGANIINDISAGVFDPKMIETVGELDCPYILMHMKGTPQTMKQEAIYDDMLAEISNYFIQKTVACRQAGIKDIILDVGFGFAKTVEQNFELLSKMSSFEILGHPILAGISRKSMIWRTLNTTANEALNGTTALHMVCLQQGAKILRVHDVKEAVECVTLYESLC